MSAAERRMRSETIRVRGIVQGVGFRPHVYRLATEVGLGGHVGNDADGVFIEVVGSARRRDAFVERLVAAPPPLAHIDSIERVPHPDAGPFEPFHIVESADGATATTRIAPDTAVCGACVAEMGDPGDRRFGHPFITCTDCGPRFTIVTGLPYDRPRTTMAAFEMCDPCRAEYSDPTDRRYHAQPIGCHDCGPTLSWHSDGAEERHDAAIGAAVEALRAGRVIAVKGIGGYHLVADAANDRAVETVRARKHRPDKPFAVMVADLDAARAVADLDERHADLLTSPAAPIVLLERRVGANLSSRVAPGNPLIGLMLAYTPVHHLLFAASGLEAMVVTSANHSGEPLLYRDDPESLAALDRLADGVLGHDREIRVPVDDSVMRLVDRRLLPVRVGRGYAPVVVPLPEAASAAPAVLAVGGELKNAAALAANGQAWVSPHIGDMGNLETLRAFEGGADHLSTLTGAVAAAVAHDLHPGYATTGWSHRWTARRDAGSGADRVAVQHHHAHVAAVAAEHGIDRPVLGVAFDGTGYGADATIWGGEFLWCDGPTFVRVGHLSTIDLPGGDAAITHPWRAALAHLFAAGIEWSDGLAPVAAVGPRERDLFETQLRRRFGTVETSSMGRLFDAVSSLVGLRQTITYEAQASIELEHAARHGDRGGSYRLDWSASDDPIVVDPAPMLNGIVADLGAGVGVGAIAAKAHRSVAAATMDVAVALANRCGVDTIALSGGVFQNALLTELCLESVRPAGLSVITHHIVPPNDGGLALGQAAVAALTLAGNPYPGPTTPIDTKAGFPCV